MSGSPLPRIVYANFPTPRHSGGVHVINQHVALLRGAGHDAWAWLPGEKPGWFPAHLPVLQGDTLTVRAEDLLVLPEVPVVQGRDPAPGARKAILNQNHFYTYASASPVDAGWPGWAPEPAVWTVSDEAREVLQRLHPQLCVGVVPNPVDPATFHRRAQAAGTLPRVAWFPRKRAREASLISALLRADPRLTGVELTEIADRTQDEVADVLGRTTVFVALGHTEGLGLPVVEALASECLVVGYDGGGGHALFERAPGAWRVPEQRPLLLVEKVAELVSRAGELGLERAANAAWAQAHHAPARTLEVLDRLVGESLAGPGAAAVATHPWAWIGELPDRFALSG